MSALSYDCPDCGGGIEVTGRDESSRLAISAYKTEHRALHSKGATA